MGSLSQNVLGACGFEMNFQYVLPGWEGSATDARVLQSALIREKLKVPQAMSKGRNVTFNAVMDEELLDGMYEQVLLGCKADRDFKGEAYEAVTVAITTNSNGEYVLTKQSIVNRCKYHKKNYSIATELLNASGFGYDNTTHHCCC